MNKTLKRVHLILAMLSVVFLLNISISGALLVFGQEIQRSVSPKTWTVVPQSLPLTLSHLLKVVKQQSDAPIKMINVSTERDHPWQFKNTTGQYFNVDQYRGVVLDQYQLEQRFYGFVMSWHRWLLLSNADGAKPLQVLVSTASVIFMIQLLLGCWLWLRPKNRLKRFKVNWRAQARIKTYQLHGVIGLIATLPLLLMAFSGIAFHWQTQTKAIVETLALSKIESPITPKVTPASPQEWQLDRAFSQGIADAQQQQAQLTRIYLPHQDQPLKLRIRMPTEWWGFSWIWIDPLTAEVIDSFDATKTSLATRIWNFKYIFHTGDFFGFASRILWLLLVLLPAGFAISGLWLYLKRSNLK